MIIMFKQWLPVRDIPDGKRPGECLDRGRRRQLFEGRLTALPAHSNRSVVGRWCVVVRHTRMRFLIDYHTGFE